MSNNSCFWIIKMVDDEVDDVIMMMLLVMMMRLAMTLLPYIG